MPDMKAVRIERFGDVDGLAVRRVPRSSRKAGEVLVKVKAAGINPGEVVVRRGMAPMPLPAPASPIACSPSRRVAASTRSRTSSAAATSGSRSSGSASPSIG